VRFRAAAGRRVKTTALLRQQQGNRQNGVGPNSVLVSTSPSTGFNETPLFESSSAATVSAAPCIPARSASTRHGWRCHFHVLTETRNSARNHHKHHQHRVRSCGRLAQESAEDQPFMTA
jgi:hypothetical protein